VLDDLVVVASESLANAVDASPVGATVALPCAARTRRAWWRWRSSTGRATT